MPWAGLGRESAMTVLLRLQGAQKYVTEMHEAAAATTSLSRATTAQGKAAQIATRRTFLHQQAIFTARRYAFYTTLAFTALTASVIRMGFAFNSAMQEAEAALSPVLGHTTILREEMNRLWTLAAITPFQFKDVTTAFRVMFASFRDLGISAAFVNTTIESVTDALSYAGNVTPQKLNRVSTALQHMALVGRPVGQTVLQLNRLGVPFTAALRHQLGLTSDQIQNIGESGVTAKQAIQALNTYIEQNPLYKGAALRMQQQTLFGAWSTFKDLVSQAAGTSTKGVFGGLFQALLDINKQLASFYTGTSQQTLTITKLARIIDSALSPRTHIIINLFTLFATVIKTVFTYFYVLFRAIGAINGALDRLGDTLGVSNAAVKILGVYLGIVTSLWLTGRVAVIAWTISTEAATIVMWPLTAATWAYNAALSFYTGAQWAAVEATWAFTAAILANPLTWIILGIAALAAGLVVLYFKWRPFHDLVNQFAGNLMFIITLVKRLITLIGEIHWPKPPGWLSWHLGTPLGFQAGGVTPYTGTFMVGERGPELVSLPQGSTIIPNAANVSPVFTPQMFGGGSDGKPQVIQLVVGRRVLAEAVAHANQDKKARK